jgi:uncharacterized membrane protein
MAEIGPVEYMAVAFPGNKFTGKVAPALKELVDSGTIRVIDLAFVGKDEKGNVVAMELEELDSEVGQAFATLQYEIGDLVNEADLKEIGAALEPNSSAAILVWEDVWAAKFANALRGAGGILIDRQLIPHEIIKAALEFSEQKQKSA